MPITSLAFVTFVLAVLAINAIVPRRIRPLWLLVSSYAFYATWSLRLLPALAVVTVANFVAAARLHTSRRRRGWLWGGIAGNVLAMLAFRHTPWLGAATVVGVSFYGVQAISYLVDTYSGALRIRPTLVELAVYLAYFPKLLAGPIERTTPFVTSLRNPRPVDPEVTAHAVALIAIGSIRKLLIAEPLRLQIPGGVFATPAAFPAATLLSAVVTLLLYVYNDFAGYTDIVRGISLRLGIPLSVNFAQPFFAKDFSQFWSRWHASLSRWLRDYVYLPMSRVILRRRPSPHSLPNLVVPPLGAMLVSAIWHGGKGGMMLWGALQGSYLIAGRVAGSRRRASGLGGAAWRRVFGSVRVFVLVAVAFVAARAGVTGSFALWTSIARNGGWALPSRAVGLLIGFSFLLDAVQYGSGDEVIVLRWPRLVQAALLACTIVACTLATTYETPATFLYQGF